MLVASSSHRRGWGGNRVEGTRKALQGREVDPEGVGGTGGAEGVALKMPGKGAVGTEGACRGAEGARR